MTKQPHKFSLEIKSFDFDLKLILGPPEDGRREKVRKQRATATRIFEASIANDLKQKVVLIIDD